MARLSGLLQGDKITPISAIVDYNCFTIMARCAELRKLGWPVRTLDVPHPNESKFPGARLPAYLLDAHFRRWIGEDVERNPADYPSDLGRGKFTRGAQS